MDVGNLTYNSLCSLSPVSPLCTTWETYYHREWELTRDMRVENWLFMSSPKATVTLVLAYLLFVVVAPRAMKHRQPFELRWPMAIYNLAMIIFNFYIMLEFHLSTRHMPNRYCSAVDYSDDPQAVRLAWTCWLYYFSKFVEFLDTVMFILRKKNNQVTFLHVYHHSTMFFLWWIGVKWVAGGMSWLGAFVNSGIHVIMYTYYFLAGLGPSFRKYLWWKKYMTTFQLIQFLSLLVHGIYSFYKRCDFPMGIQIDYCLYIFSHVLLFSHFYWRTYRKQKVSAAAAKEE